MGGARGWRPRYEPLRPASLLSPTQSLTRCIVFVTQMEQSEAGAPGDGLGAADRGDTAYSAALTRALRAMPTMAIRGPGRASRGEINDQSRLGAAGGVPTLGSRDPAEPGRADDHAGLTDAHAWRCAAGQVLGRSSAFLESEHRAGGEKGVWGGKHRRRRRHRPWPVFSVSVAGADGRGA